uniref:Uncharacterized protein n=1 Tax=Glossina palpalis gambiensis TaxID=67801 RepID=A0A1B0ARQ1_9MUSC
MNLMFRKNFREGGSGKAAVGGGKLQSKANRTKRSREMGGSGGGQGDEIHYRTHLFFAPSRPGYDVGEERCSGFTTLPITHELDAPQPLVDRKPSVSLLRWNNYNYNGNNNNNNIRVQNEFNPLLETIDENVSPATYGYPITGYTAAHTLDLYSEVAAICRPPLVLGPSDVGGFKKTQTPATGYIISVFKASA